MACECCSVVFWEPEVVHIESKRMVQVQPASSSWLQEDKKKKKNTSPYCASENAWISGNLTCTEALYQALVKIDFFVGLCEIVLKPLQTSLRTSSSSIVHVYMRA